MSDQLMLDVDQAGELKAAFRRTRGSDGSEWTNEKIKKSSEGNIFGLFLDVLDGRAKIVPVDSATEIAKSNPKIYLRDLYLNEVIELGPDDGTRMLANAKGTFRAGVDNDFVNWKLNKKRSKKDKIQVRVREMVEDGMFVHIFGFLFQADPDVTKIKEFIEEHRQNLRKLCVGQGQVEEFAAEHRDKLRKDGCATFFLLENEDTGEFFVAFVAFDSDDTLYVLVDRLGFSHVWHAEGRHRVVTPQLA